MSKRFTWSMAALLFAALFVASASAQLGAADSIKPHDPADLAIGKVAPEIEAEDVYGVPLKLSDYRGKVVVLDFWGDW